MSRNTNHDHLPLASEDLEADPIAQFGVWFDEAARLLEMPEAVTLATADLDGTPDARMVLMKGFAPDGFRFFTNHDSAKGSQLDANPRAAMVFFWRELDRQVRIRGRVSRLPDDESDAYYATRGRDSRLGAWASPQSRVIKNRQELDRRLEEAESRFAEPGSDVSRPSNWGGYILEPAEIEFWQGQRARLHDRFLYTRRPDHGWSVDRLAP